MNSPVRLGISPMATTPIGFYCQRCWGFLFLRWNPGLCGLSRSPVAPPGLSACRCGTTSCCLTHLILQLLPCCTSSPPWLPISALPTSLDECFFFNSLLSDFFTVRFSGRSGCFLFLNLLLSFFWLCKEAKSIYRCLHLSRKWSKPFNLYSLQNQLSSFLHKLFFWPKFTLTTKF